jgi:rhodanese-related sulfurtransferase
VKYMRMGYWNITALGGGVEAWKKAGYKIVGN